MNARATQEVVTSESSLGSLPQLGQRLREARDARGVTLEEVAARLRLGVATIRSMEEGSFERLPAATYARGYLRAYSNFLGLDAEPLLQAYDQYADKPPELNPFASSPPPQIQASDLPVRAVTYGIAMLLIALLGAWLWQTQQFSSVDALSMPKWGAESDPAAVQPITEQVQAVPAEVAPAPAAAEIQNPTSPAVTAGGVAPGPAAVVADAPLPDPVGSAAGNPGDSTSVPATGAGAEAAPVAAASATDQPSATGIEPATPTSLAETNAAVAVNAPGMQVVPATGEIPYASPPSPASDSAVPSDATAIGVATGPQAISFDLAEDSWLEVYDAEDKRLYYNIGRQGTRVSVQGVLPYRVKVGNAPAVLVSYQGHSLDITAFSTGSVARFQVTPDGFLAQP
jgi:cytoskeleton protein RodZ